MYTYPRVILFRFYVYSNPNPKDRRRQQTTGIYLHLASMQGGDEEDIVRLLQHILVLAF